MDARQLLQCGDAFREELLVDREHLPPAADHAEVGAGRADDLPQRHRIVPVAARHQDDIGLRRLGPAPGHFDHAVHDHLIRVRQPLPVGKTGAVGIFAR